MLTSTIPRLPDSLSGLSDPMFAVVLAVVGFLTSVVAFVFCPFFVRYAYSVLGMESDASVRATRDAVSVTVFVVFAGAALSGLSLDRVYSVFLSVSLSVLMVLWLWVAYHIGSPLIDRIVEYRYDADLVPIVRNSWVLSLIVFAAVGLFEVWDIDPTPLLASAGVAGIVLGLAARETISNFFGSVALYADDTYEVGDYIEVEGESGFVEEISIRSTRLRTRSNNSVTVPNSKLHDSIVKNLQTPTVSRRIEIEVGVGYGEDLDRVRNLVEDAVTEVAEENGGLIDTDKMDEMSALVKEFGDSAVLLSVFVWTEQPAYEPRLRDRLNAAIYETLRENGVEIPYPQRSVHLQDREEEPDNGGTG